MPLILETGTGLSNSNSYSDYDKFVAYHDARRNTFADARGCIEAALIKATDYIDSMFDFRGCRMTTAQALEFPRSLASYDDGRRISGVPIEVEEACNEYALRSLSSELAPDPTYSPSGAIVLESRKSIGPLSKFEKLGNAGNPAKIRSYPLADRRLSKVTINGQYVERA